MADPIPMRMNDANALRWLREIAADSGRVIVTEHALQRMRQRGVTFTMLMACLQRGLIEEPVALNRHGHWKLTVRHRVAGKDLSSAVAVDIPHKAIVITVF